MRTEVEEPSIGEKLLLAGLETCDKVGEERITLACRFLDVFAADGGENDGEDEDLRPVTRSGRSGTPWPAGCHAHDNDENHDDTNGDKNGNLHTGSLMCLLPL